MRLKVELIYDPGCPNVDAARQVLGEAFGEVGAPAMWTEWSTDEQDCPDEVRGYGSPTILVNRADVAPGPHPWAPRAEGSGPRCRLYASPHGRSGAPSLELVVQAFREALEPEAG